MSQHGTDYSQALESQMQIARFIGSEQGKQFMRLLWGGTPMPGGSVTSSEMIAQVGVEYGETFYWAPPLCQTLAEVAPTLPPWTLTPDAIPCPVGFMWLAHPLPMPTIFDRDGAPVAESISAVSWAILYRPDDGADDPNSGWLLPVTGAEVRRADGLGLTFYSDFLSDSRASRVTPSATWTWRVGETHEAAAARSRELKGDSYKTLRLGYLAAAFAFLEQQIVVASSQQAVRSTRRRLERLRWTHEPAIRVVELRRRSTAPAHEHGADSPEWSCQWVVRGHWRQQACGPERALRQPRWILPYVKGPEDKPLKPPRARVFAVVR